MLSLATSSAAAAGVIRGIYDEETDPEFRSVKTFETAEECLAWYHARVRCTNPAYSECRQIYTTLCDWEQVEALLLHKLADYRSRISPTPLSPLPSSNVFAAEPAIRDSLRARLDLPFHRRTTPDSTLNTLRYMFHHLRCGIFVLIRANQLRMFVPFVNKDYVNTWGGLMDIENDDLAEYVRDKHDAGTHEEYIMDKLRWWANGNIVCNVQSPAHWGDSYLPQLRDMLQTLCATRTVPDAEFFVNKRDFPQLKRNLTEPYDFIYDQDNVPLERERYSSYAPIASFFVGADFADVPFVTTDDWETATGRVYPPNATDIRSAKNRGSHQVQWKDKVSTAFFRGNSTGPGTDADTNQRIHLAAVSAAWAKDPARAAGNALDGVRFLDAGIVGWNLRDRKMQGRPMTFIRPDRLGIDKVDRVPMYAQSRYKYHIYVDGHCAAMRFASMMPLGSVILKVSSITKADSMWFFPLLRPYDIRSASPDPSGDHIPVAADLSDLAEVIAWAKTHDAECAAIAANSASLYSRVVAREGQLDFMQLVVHEIASRFEGLQGGPGGSSAGGAGEAPTVPLLRPALAAPPAGEVDWFGAACDEYSNTRIGVSVAPGPDEPDLATLDCGCPTCERLRAAAQQRRETEAALQQQVAAEAAAASAVAAASKTEHRAPAGVTIKLEAGNASIAAAVGVGSATVGAPQGASASAPGTASSSIRAPPIAVNDKLKAALAARAALAKAKQSEREGGGQAPASQYGSGLSAPASSSLPGAGGAAAGAAVGAAALPAPASAGRSVTLKLTQGAAPLSSAAGGAAPGPGALKRPRPAS